MHFDFSSQNFVRQADTTSEILLTKAVGFVYYDDVVNQAHVWAQRICFNHPPNERANMCLVSFYK